MGGSEAAMEGVELGAREGDAATGDIAAAGVATGGGCAACCWPHDDQPASENRKFIIGVEKAQRNTINVH